MNHRWYVISTLAVALVVLSCSGSYVWASSDFCTSEEFREAFLDGQQGIIDMYTSPSPKLIAMGNRVLPCLVEIAEKGGDRFGINTCIGREHGCQSWALVAIRMIGTPEARQYLISNLDEEKERYLIRIAIREVGTLRDSSARPALQKLLQHGDPVIRTESLVSLAALGDRSDFEAMLKVALLLPDEQLRAAANGFRILGDPRAFDALRERIETIKDPDIRHSVEGVLSNWRQRISEEKRVLAILRSTGIETQELCETIRLSGSRSDETRAALRELLEHESHAVRAEAIRTLGSMRDPSDYEALLNATLSLQDQYIIIGIRTIVGLDDPRAIEPLAERARAIKHAGTRELVERTIEQLRSRTR